MKKDIIVIVAIVIVIAVVAIGGFFILKDKGDKNAETVKIETAKDMEDVINKIYTKLEGKLPSLQTQEISKEDEAAFTTYTGLKSADNVESLVVSEPMMSSQAYSLVMVKVNKNADIEAMKKEMKENIDTRKWICVEAEKLYVTSYENVIFLIMASDEWATPVYNEFKNLVGGKIGEELVKTTEI